MKEKDYFEYQDKEEFEFSKARYKRLIHQYLKKRKEKLEFDDSNDDVDTDWGN